jgi:hypothetical protein
MLVTWKKGTGYTLIHMQIIVFMNEVLVFDDFDFELTVTGLDPEG